jgi:hypothetical protein
MDKNTKYHLSRINRAWPLLTPEQRVYFIVKIEILVLGAKWRRFCCWWANRFGGNND